MTLKEQLLQSVKKQSTPVNFAGVDCFIKPLTFSGLMKWHSLMEDETTSDFHTLYLIPLSLVDAEDKPLFTIDEMNIVDSFSAPDLSTLIKQIMDINGIGNDLKKN
jgi:hypothetical protein